jgi:hypothetical protein
MEISHPILSRKIEQIATSNDFLIFCRQNGFSTLGVLMQHTADELLKKPGFNTHLMMELITILKGNKLEYLLKDAV